MISSGLIQLLLVFFFTWLLTDGRSCLHGHLCVHSLVHAGARGKRGQIEIYGHGGCPAKNGASRRLQRPLQGEQHPFLAPHCEAVHNNCSKYSSLSGKLCTWLLFDEICICDVAETWPTDTFSEKRYTEKEDLYNI